MKQTILVCSDILTYHQVLHLTDTCKDKFASIAFKTTFDKDEPVFLLIRKDEHDLLHLDVMPTCRNHRIPWVHPEYYYVTYDKFIAFLDGIILIPSSTHNFPNTPDYIVCKGLTQGYINSHYRNIPMDRAVKEELLNGVGLCDGFTLAYNNRYRQFTYAKEFPGNILEMGPDEFYDCLDVPQFVYSDKVTAYGLSDIMHVILYSREGILSENIQKIIKNINKLEGNDYLTIRDEAKYYLKYDVKNHVLDSVESVPEGTEFVDIYKHL